MYRKSWIALVAALMAAALAPSIAHADRAFAPRFSTDDNGDIAIVGNTLASCPDLAPGCAEARAGGAAQDNIFPMVPVDVDGDATTTNSSRATLTLPPGSEVLFAGLYWGARSTNVIGRGRISFATPGAAGYRSLTASQVDRSSDRGETYQSFRDVTALVRAAGNGAYTAAGVAAQNGEDRWAGWSLVVAYRDSTQPPRNLTVFDGLDTVSLAFPRVSIPLAGFRTPTTGPVRTTLGVVAYDGDKGPPNRYTGDSLTLSTPDPAAPGGVRRTAITDPANPADDVFNSTIGRRATPFTDKEPDYRNQLGYDADLFGADGALPNNASRATISLTTNVETYLPGVVTFATDLYAPRLETDKAVTDLNGGDVEAGDVLEYAVTGRNTGQDGADDVRLTDPLPAGTSFVPGSIRIGGAPRTDAGGDDTAEYTAGTRSVVARLGDGASATAGGRLVQGASFALAFRVTVDGGLADGTVLTNQAGYSYRSQTLGADFPDQRTPSVQSVVRAPDLALTKLPPAELIRGATATYQLVATNRGGGRTQGTYRVTDALPVGLSPAGTPTGDGWTCTVAGVEVTCSRSEALAPGASAPPIAVPVAVAPDAPPQITNAATVSGGGDVNTDNNTGTATGPVGPQSDLSVAKVGGGPVPAGGTATWTLSVANAGPSPATGVTLTDPLPAGLVPVAQATTQGTCTVAGSVLSCAIGTLAAGSSATVTVAAVVPAALAGQSLTNVATVAGAQPDPDPDDNSATAVTPVIVPAAGGVAGQVQAGGPPNLRIVKRAPATATVRQALTYTLEVSNAGPGDATNVRVDDAVVAQARPESAVPSQGSCELAQTVSCRLGTLRAGAKATITLRVVPRETGRLGNVATVTSTEPDSAPADNRSVAGSTVRRPATRLSLAKVAGASRARPGGRVTWTIRVRNRGEHTAAGVRVCDALPGPLTFVSAPGAVLRGARACWTVDRLAAGGSRTYRLHTRVDTDAPLRSIRNTARAQASNAPGRSASARTSVRGPRPGAPGGGVTG